MVEENVQQAARELGQTLIEMVMNNPAYQELGQHVGLQQLSDTIEAGTQKLETAGTTIPQSDTRVREPVFNMPIPRECIDIQQVTTAPMHCTLQRYPHQ